MVVPAHILQQAMELYLQMAYPGGAAGGSNGIPPGLAGKLGAIRRLAPDENVPMELLEKDTTTTANGVALRLGQPMYPFMKLALDPVPEGHRCGMGAGYDFLLRVDSHDRHLHAAAGSPDAEWLAKVRESNRVLGEKIEAAWAGAGLPTFKEFLRGQLEKRRARGRADEHAV